MKLEGKTAIVTGAARGIGRAIAIALVREGASLVLADLKPSKETVSQIINAGFTAKAIHTDVSDPEAVENLVSETLSLFGSVDILVNNAGIIHRGDFMDLKREDWESILQVNLGGTFNCCRSVVPHLVKQRSGKIINITSVAGKIGDITASPAYGTSKGAINTLTKSLARQLAEFGINVNAIAPHAIETDMSAEWSEEKRRAIIDAIPLKRLGKPEEVAAAVVFLCSEDAGFITGEIMNINGGYLMD